MHANLHVSTGAAHLQANMQPCIFQLLFLIFWFDFPFFLFPTYLETYVVGVPGSRAENVGLPPPLVAIVGTAGAARGLVGQAALGPTCPNLQQTARAKFGAENTGWLERVVIILVSYEWESMGFWSACYTTEANTSYLTSGAEFCVRDIWLSRDTRIDCITDEMFASMGKIHIKFKLNKRSINWYTISVLW